MKTEKKIKCCWGQVSRLSRSVFGTWGQVASFVSYISPIQIYIAFMTCAPMCMCVYIEFTLSHLSRYNNS